MIPEFLDKPERPRHRRDRPEQEHAPTKRSIFQEHVDLAMKTNELILIHTPHLEDKYKGTRMIVDMLKNDPRIKPRARAASTTSRSTRCGWRSTTASGAA